MCLSVNLILPILYTDRQYRTNNFIPFLSHIHESVIIKKHHVLHYYTLHNALHQPPDVLGYSLEASQPPSAHHYCCTINTKKSSISLQCDCTSPIFSEINSFQNQLLSWRTPMSARTKLLLNLGQLESSQQKHWGFAIQVFMCVLHVAAISVLQKPLL